MKNADLTVDFLKINNLIKICKKRSLLYKITLKILQTRGAMK